MQVTDAAHGLIMSEEELTLYLDEEAEVGDGITKEDFEKETGRMKGNLAEAETIEVEEICKRKRNYGY